MTYNDGGSDSEQIPEDVLLSGESWVGHFQLNHVLVEPVCIKDDSDLRPSEAERGEGTPYFGQKLQQPPSVKIKPHIWKKPKVDTDGNDERSSHKSPEQAHVSLGAS